MIKVMAILFLTSATLVFVLAISGLFGDSRWSFIKSPNTGICYETRSTVFGIGISEAMSPVDSKYCENKK